MNYYGLGQATTGQAAAPLTAVTTVPAGVNTTSNPLQGSEGLMIVAGALTLGPLLLLPGWWKILALAGPLFFLNALGPEL